MIDRGGTNLDARLSEQEPLAASRLSDLRAFEPPAPGELSRCEVPGIVDFRNPEDEVAAITFDQIPGIRLELMFDRVDEAGRPIETDDLFPGPGGASATGRSRQNGPCGDE